MEDGLPVVVINADAGPRLAQVLADDAMGTALAVDHLVDLGHRHLLYLGPDVGRHPSIAARGISGSIARLAGRDGENGEDQVRREIATAGAAGDGPVTGLVAYNHWLARVALRACVAQGVPRDASVISCDDVGALTYAIPALSAVRVPVHEMATAATDLLVACIEGRQRPQAVRNVLIGTLVARESTGPAGPGRRRGAKHPRAADARP